MKTIPISGVIGWDVSAAEIRKALAEAKGEPVTFEISSPGGLVSAGLEIYNVIRAYKGETTSHYFGVVASMGTVVGLASKKAKAERAAVFMIHNASGVALGTRHDMDKMAEILGGFDAMMAQIYADKSGKSVGEIHALMDAETYYFGDEIADAGFADEMTGEPPSEDKAAARSKAAALIMAADDTLRQIADEDAPDKIAALLPSHALPAGVASSAAPAQAAAISQEEVLMDLNLETLKAEHPDVYAQALDEGKKIGADAEHKRREQLCALRGMNAEGDKAVEAAIASGESYADAAPKIQAAAFRGLGGENAPAIGSKAPDSASGADGLTADDIKAAGLMGMSLDDYRKYSPKDEE